MRLRSVQLETNGNKVRHWTESTHQVVQAPKVVGVVKISETETRRADVLAEFASSKQTIKNLKALRLPAEFSYVWIEVIRIQELSRRRGYGTQIFDLIKATRRNALLGLNPHQIAADYPIEAILGFYRKQGFRLSRFEYEWYGFLYLP
jgi:GNAT superfamily N-acetyltransferase